MNKIWLIRLDDRDQVWADCPDPSPGIDPEDVTGPFVLQSDLEAEIEAIKEDRNEVIRKVERMKEWMQSRAAPPNIKDDTGRRVDIWEWYLKLNDEDA